MHVARGARCTHNDVHRADDRAPSHRRPRQSRRQPWRRGHQSVAGNPGVGATSRQRQPWRRGHQSPGRPWRRGHQSPGRPWRRGHQSPPTTLAEGPPDSGSKGGQGPHQPDRATALDKVPSGPRGSPGADGDGPPPPLNMMGHAVADHGGPAHAGMNRVPDLGNPAEAGMNPPYRPQPTARSGWPRARGDEPLTELDSDWRAQVAPRARG